MMTSLWLGSLVAVLVVDMRTGALQQKELATHHCYQCSRNEICDVPVSAECPTDRPYCATTAATPNFTSSLSCVASAAAKTPCSLTQSSDKVFELTCVCMEDLCNAPFLTEIQKKLLNFTSSNSAENSTDCTEVFFKFANLSVHDYKNMIVTLVQTTKNPVTLQSTVSASAVSARSSVVGPVENMPRSEALKQDAPAPSDDDEDESEGSGSYEETRIQRQPAAAPANPSSYLPAENKAPHINLNLLTLPPIFYFIA
ncbi:hypothetical protein evm_004974 [Chilo suppressalis]|nr:hypothetical protein evm_004974 [Chilo suppressalis]